MSTNAPALVLYLDHDEDSGKMLFTLLGFEQIRVVCVHSVENAAFVAQTANADLFLLADRFDDINVTNLCRTLRVDFPTKPIVFYSANARGVDIKKGLAAGADAYLIKPDSENIAPTIKQLIERYARISRCSVEATERPDVSLPIWDRGSLETTDAIWPTPINIDPMRGSAPTRVLPRSIFIEKGQTAPQI
jgi:DNA-binding response OmpR family regulator